MTRLVVFQWRNVAEPGQNRGSFGGRNRNGAGIATDPTLTGGGLHEEVLYAQRVAPTRRLGRYRPALAPVPDVSLAQMSSLAGLHRSKRLIRDWQLPDVSSGPCDLAITGPSTSGFPTRPPMVMSSCFTDCFRVCLAGFPIRFTAFAFSTRLSGHRVECFRAPILLLGRRSEGSFSFRSR